jgi:hypothetical protein
MNQREIAEFDTASMGELVGRLRSRAAKYGAFWPDQPLDTRFPYRTGYPLDAATLRSNWVSELIIHSRDIAVAAGQPWQLDDTSCLLTLRVLAHVLPRYVLAAGLDDYALTIAPDGGMPFSIVVRTGAAAMQPDAIEGADRLSGSPAALVLLLYGRIDLAEAQQSFASVTGDAERVDRFLRAVEKP